MLKRKSKIVLIIIFLHFVQVKQAFPQINPAEVFGSLFTDVQEKKIFADQKKFPDCTPKHHPDSILKKFEHEKDKPGFDLKHFVAENFDTLFTDSKAVLRHIDNLWGNLLRNPDKAEAHSSLIPLPYPYIVPGGRFREIYYWDSYFTMLGLAEAAKFDVIEGMIKNFCHLIDQHGHIPNGNRTYYLSRSQPPFFSLMIDLLAEEKGDSVYIVYLPYLEKEYHFWMEGKSYLLKKQNESKRVVRVNRNEYLNRYRDDETTPRPESFRIDNGVFKQSGRDSSVFRDIRSAAESGWDFSSRWFGDGNSLSSIHTTDILPVDLNCLLYHLELSISKAYLLSDEEEKSVLYAELAEIRKALINTIFWNEPKGYYFDFDIKNKTQTGILSLAGVYPLFFKVSDSATAKKVMLSVRNNFLKEGGVVTTLTKTGEQWDYPNGWPPLQWITYKALKNYNYSSLADSIAQRWLNLNMKVYSETGKMMEKYDVIDVDKPGGGGEYPLQDGFGWTNGVFLKLWNEQKIK